MSEAFHVLCEALPLATLVMVLALHFSSRSASPATRGHQLLMAGCVISMLSPVLVGLMPKWQVLPSVPMGFGTGLPSMRGTSMPDYPLWFRCLGWSWMAGLLVSLAALGRELARRRSFWRESEPPPRDLEEVLVQLAARRGIGRRVRLRLHPTLEGACTWGVCNPVILVPRREAGLSAEEMRMMLDHELGHIQRLDAVSGWLLQFFVACYWFHPCAKWMARRVELLKERACDDLVLLSGNAPAAYAACLGSAALRAGSNPGIPAGASAFVRRHPLLARLDAILDSRQVRTPLSLDETFRAVAPITLFAVLLSAFGFKVASEVQPKSPEWIAGKPGVSVPSLWSDVIRPASVTVASVVGIPGLEPSREAVAAPSRDRAASRHPSPPEVAASGRPGIQPSSEAGLSGAPRAPGPPPGSTALALSAAMSQRPVVAPSARSGGGSFHPAGISTPPPTSGATTGTVSDSITGETVPNTVSEAFAVTNPSDRAGEYLIGPTVETPGATIATVAIQVLDDEGIAIVGEAVPLPQAVEPSTATVPTNISTGIEAGSLVGTDSGVPPAGFSWPAATEVLSIPSEAGEHFAIAIEVPTTEAGAWRAEASTDAQIWTHSSDVVMQWTAPGSIADTRLVQAVVTEPIQTTSYRFLRLTTGW